MVVTEPTGAHRSHAKLLQRNKHTNRSLEAEDHIAEKRPGGVDNVMLKLIQVWWNFYIIAIDKTSVMSPVGF